MNRARKPNETFAQYRANQNQEAKQLREYCHGYINVIENGKRQQASYWRLWQRSIQLKEMARLKKLGVA